MLLVVSFAEPRSTASISEQVESSGDPQHGKWDNNCSTKASYNDLYIESNDHYWQKY